MRILTLGVALAALAGCTNGNAGIYLVQMPVDIDEQCTTTIKENFTDANPPEEVDADPDWIYDYERAYSDSLFFAQIVKGKKGGFFLVIGNRVYPGAKDKDGYEFSWTNSEKVDETLEFAPSPYLFTQVRDEQLITTVRFNKDRETAGFVGNWKTELKIDQRFTESDRWNNQVPQITGQINNYSYQYLVGNGRSNVGNEDNCDSDPCFIEVGIDCKASAQFTAAWTSYSEEGTYEYLENVQQPGGY